MASPRGRRPCVYILRCADGSLYTGVAKEVTRRLAQHAAGRASRYTRARLPVTLVWLRRARSWSDALRIECRIKALRRRQKDALLCGAAPLPRVPRVLARKRRAPSAARGGDQAAIAGSTRSAH